MTIDERTECGKLTRTSVGRIKERSKLEKEGMILIRHQRYNQGNHRSAYGSRGGKTRGRLIHRTPGLEMILFMIRLILPTIINGHSHWTIRTTALVPVTSFFGFLTHCFHLRGKYAGSLCAYQLFLSTDLSTDLMETFFHLLWRIVAYTMLDGAGWT